MCFIITTCSPYSQPPSKKNKQPRRLLPSLLEESSRQTPIHQHYSQARFGHCRTSSCNYYLHTTAPRHRSASRALQQQAGIYNRQTLCIPHHPQLHLHTILQTFFERPGAACFVRYEAAIWVTAACICTTPFIRLGLH